MNYFKHVCLSLTLICGVILSSIPLKSGGLQLNPADLEGLNLSDADSQGLNDFLEFLNNMPPEAQEELAKVGKEIDDKMRSKGLDPLNPDDIFKFMEQEEQEKPSDTKIPNKSQEAKKPEIQKPVQQAAPIAVVNPSDARAMLIDLAKRLASVRQKAGQFPQMNHKLERWHQELNDLMYYLSLLRDEPLLAYITSKEFTKLYKNLDALRTTLAVNEPLIRLKESSKLSEENPYDMLGISYTASQDEIDLAFNALKETNEPHVIERRLSARNVPKKERLKKAKEAALSFKFIQDAYDSLKDPKQRALTDRSLREQIDRDKQRITTAHTAFDKIIDQLSMALYSQKVVGDIEQLLKQHQPKELEIKKAQDVLEQQAIKRAAQPIKIDTRGMQQRYNQKDEYSDFYNQIRQDAARSQYSSQQGPRPSGPDFTPGNGQAGHDSKGDSGNQAGQGKSEDKQGTGKKGEADKKKEAASKEAKKDADKKPSTGTGSKTPKLAEKEEGRLEALVEQIGKNLAAIKDEFDDQGALTKTQEGEATRAPAKTVSLIAAVKNAESYITKPVTRGDKGQAEKAVLQPLETFVLQSDFKDLLANLHKVWSQIDKIKDNEALKKLWKEKVFDPYGHKIISWYKALYPTLSSQTRKANRKPAFNDSKSKELGLNKSEVDVAKPTGDRQKEFSKEAASKSLAVARDWPKEAHYYFDTISKALSIKEFPPLLKSQEQKDAQEVKKAENAPARRPARVTSPVAPVTQPIALTGEPDSIPVDQERQENISEPLTQEHTATT